MKHGTKVVPWARGGKHMVYNPTEFTNAFLANNTVPVRLPVESPALCSDRFVESIVVDHKEGTLVTLVNWTNGPVKNLEVQVRVKDAPKTVRTVSGQRNLDFTHKDGVVAFRLDLAEADYIVLK
jgi:hypothetical protein